MVMTWATSLVSAIYKVSVKWSSLIQITVEDDEEIEEEVDRPQRAKGKKKTYIESSDEDSEEEKPKVKAIEISDSGSESEYEVPSFTRAGMAAAAAKAKAKGKAPLVASATQIAKRKESDNNGPRAQPKMMEKFIPSTKMKWVMNQLNEWQKTHPDDKVRWLLCSSHSYRY